MTEQAGLANAIQVGTTSAAAENDAERLGIIVGSAYGTALAERDQARDIADRLAGQLADALTHLATALAAVPEVASSFAGVNDDVDAARKFLAESEGAKAVGSPEPPEQETR